MGAIITKIKRILVEPSLNEREILELKMKALSKKLSFVQESFSQAENDLSKILSEGTSKMFQEDVVVEEQKIIKKVILLSQREQEELKRREEEELRQIEEAIERSKLEEVIEEAIKISNPRGGSVVYEGGSVYEGGGVYDLVKDDAIDDLTRRYFRNCRPAAEDFFKSNAEVFESFIETKIAAVELGEIGFKNPKVEDVEEFLFFLHQNHQMDALMFLKYFDFISIEFVKYFEGKIQNNWDKHQNWLNIYFDNQPSPILDVNLDDLGLGLVFSVSTRISIFCILEYLKFRKIHNLFIKIKVLEFFEKKKKNERELTNIVESVDKSENSNIPN